MAAPISPLYEKILQKNTLHRALDLTIFFLLLCLLAYRLLSLKNNGFAWLVAFLFDYPANKLSCYVSDDGASPLTFYALLEASKFSKLWVPFCKKYGIQTRAPFRYFSSELVSSNDNSMEFLQEYRKMKHIEYCKV
ncbi:Cellulose synthase-like protein B5 [Vitis vinifera]|uniref:Cellulose synthase-like protein B5 n=1 Tax=Vitis vinifera TaxID=29760 RepID=A0A438IL15_VITVI|nr:Cellulose synthase-like protein B5 [Vitis vinifera]